MGTLVTVFVGLALAGATTFGLVTAGSSAPSGQAPSAGVTYDAGK